MHCCGGGAAAADVWLGGLSAMLACDGAETHAIVVVVVVSIP